jgi:hypothetical protein
MDFFAIYPFGQGNNAVQPISGTVTALQGTSPWIVAGTVAVSNFPSSFIVNQGTSPWVISGTVSVNPITFAAPQHVILDSGTLTSITNPVVVNQGTSPWVVSGTVTTSPNVNVHDASGNPISSTGTSLNVDVTNTVPITGTVTANQGTSPWVVSGTVTANAGTGNFTVVQTTGTNLHTVVDNFPTSFIVNQGTSPWVVSGTVSVNPITFASPQHVILDSGTLTSITNPVVVNQGTSPWVVSGTVTANAGSGNFTVVQTTGTNLHVVVDNFPADADALAQGSTTAGQLGALIMGAVTTNAPSYTTAQTSPLSLDLSGLLRVSLKDTPSNTNKLLVTADPITFASPQHVILDSGTLTTITNPVTVNQGTSPWVVSGAVTLPYDTNYGTVGANTLRTAAEIGNATGAANFNAGATGAQTLRTTANISDGAGTALTSTLFNSKQSLDVRPNTGFSTPANTTPAITSASSVVLAANLNRKYAYVSNNTGGVVFIKLGAAAALNTGIRIANNGMYEINANNLWTGTINAIKPGAGSVNLDIFEGTP